MSRPLQAQQALRRMWDDVHTLKYTTYDPKEAAAAQKEGDAEPLAADQLPQLQPVRQVISDISTLREPACECCSPCGRSCNSLCCGAAFFAATAAGNHAAGRCLRRPAAGVRL